MTIKGIIKSIARIVIMAVIGQKIDANIAVPMLLSTYCESFLKRHSIIANVTYMKIIYGTKPYNNSISSCVITLFLWKCTFEIVIHITHQKTSINDSLHFFL